MKLIEEFKTPFDTIVTFWEGYDIKKLEKHPKDGSKGMFIVFVKSVELKKNLKNELIKNFNNSYLAIYEVPDGIADYSERIRIFKLKFSQRPKNLFGVKGGETY